MTSCIDRWRAWRERRRPPATGDPTRPRAVVRDGVPIIHEGPPGFPGRPEPDDTTDPPSR
ncbi:MAG TPA: hypothetical protein VFU19_09195 [Iamia sp.]|nr:hypothetical protein [Iamia sp.]